MADKLLTTVFNRLLSELGENRTVAKSKKNKSCDPTRLNPIDRRHAATVHGVIETPGGSRNRFKYDETLGFYALPGVGPEGMFLPHAFGFAPRIQAADGDPEDILMVMDKPTFRGCVVPARLLRSDGGGADLERKNRAQPPADCGRRS